MSVRSPLVGVVAVATMAVAACNSGSGAAETGGTERGLPAGGADADPALFDSEVVHEIEVTFDEDVYDAMIETFSDSGEKEWIEATVTIDGVTYERVGLRLKGNSSLAGLGGFGGRPRPGADESTEESRDETASTDEATGDGPTAGRGGGFGPAGSVSAEEPESLPWLIRLDRFVEGQDHQGYEDVVIRSNRSATSLNDAVALDLLEQAGLASQQAAATSFSVNGSDAVLRLAIEHPDDDAWQEEHFDSAGALYKAESSGDWSYRGDDAAAYEEVFDQEGGSDVVDLTPLIEFLQFINESDDATFAAELPQRLDLDSFATYLAMMDLVANSDDIDGPGNNAYLWYDVESGQFTIVPWDMNLAFGALGAFGGDMTGRPPTDGELPENFDPPPRGELPDDFDPPANGELPDDFGSSTLPSRGDGGFGGFGRSNPLVERFHANAEFEAFYQLKLTELRADLYDSGVADDILAAWVETLTEQATGLVDESTITAEAQTIADQFTAE